MKQQPSSQDSDVAVAFDRLLERLNGRVHQQYGESDSIYTTVAYDFEHYTDACIFAEVVRARGGYHGEPVLWGNGKTRLITTTDEKFVPNPNG